MHVVETVFRSIIETHILPSFDIFVVEMDKNCYIYFCYFFPSVLFE
jgi:hypothetical protein